MIAPRNTLFPTEEEGGLTYKPNGKTKRIYLFTYFQQFTVNDVAVSCKYYANYVTFPLRDGVSEGNFTNELKWSYAYFRNNVEPRIYEVVQADYATFDSLEQGGPLFLKLLLDHLVVSNDANKAALVDTVFNYNIKTNSKTEDIPQVCRTLSAITDTIIAIRDHKDNTLPDDYIQNLAKIFQTTSVESFNRAFDNLEDDVTYSHRFRRVTTPTALHHHQLASSSLATHITMDNTPAYCTIVFALANEAYKDLHQDGTRNTTLRHDVDNVSAMVTDSNHPSSSNRCWNCGETDCNVMTCPKPKSPICIAANRKLFYKNKRAKDDKSITKTPPKDTTKPIPHAWRNPEPHEHNKRVIFGKPHTFNPAKSGWDEDETPPSSLAAGIPPPATPTTIKVDSGATDTTSLTGAETRQTVLNLINLIWSSSHSVADAWDVMN